MTAKKLKDMTPNEKRDRAHLYMAADGWVLASCAMANRATGAISGDGKPVNASAIVGDAKALRGLCVGVADSDTAKAKAGWQYMGKIPGTSLGIALPVCMNRLEGPNLFAGIADKSDPRVKGITVFTKCRESAALGDLLSSAESAAADTLASLVGMAARLKVVSLDADQSAGMLADAVAAGVKAAKVATDSDLYPALLAAVTAAVSDMLASAGVKHGVAVVLPEPEPEPAAE